MHTKKTYHLLTLLIQLSFTILSCTKHSILEWSNGSCWFDSAIHCLSYCDEMNRILIANQNEIKKIDPLIYTYTKLVEHIHNNKKTPDKLSALETIPGTDKKLQEFRKIIHDELKVSVLGSHLGDSNELARKIILRISEKIPAAGEALKMQNSGKYIFYFMSTLFTPDTFPVEGTSKIPKEKYFRRIPEIFYISDRNISAESINGFTPPIKLTISPERIISELKHLIPAEGISYDLFAVIMEIPGHYWACVKDYDGKWYQYNMSLRTEITADKIYSGGAAAGTFYRINPKSLPIKLSMNQYIDKKDLEQKLTNLKISLATLKTKLDTLRNKLKTLQSKI